MNKYTADCYKKHLETAESCKDRLLDLHKSILAKMKRRAINGDSYSPAERKADSDALREASEQLNMAIEALLTIEENEIKS